MTSYHIISYHMIHTIVHKLRYYNLILNYVSKLELALISSLNLNSIKQIEEII